jgi:hypothetical protein
MFMSDFEATMDKLDEEQPQVLRLAALAQDDRSILRSAVIAGY